MPGTNPPDGEGCRPRTGRLELNLTLYLVLNSTESLPVSARLVYDSAQPFGIRMEFPDSTEGFTPWVFSRELLRSGLRTPSGDGDVRIWPPCHWHGRTMVRVLLRGRGPSAMLDVPAAPLRDWLDQTLTEVPEGAEGAMLSWDEILERLVSGG
ncbi:SsgA family sporulation/cell division regulator [Streptomyces sp.]|uniref:SsgA family sporulation/cell division regulator n=1 Tax=Streptomyces sp. TaxID=1931 RepID=UPI002F3FCA5C